MHEHDKINYLEFPAKDISATKTFFLPPSTGHLLTSALNILHSQTPELMVASINQT